MPPKKNSVPDRWTDYKAVGKRIPGTRFITFKVPLRESFRRHLKESEVFGPFDLVDKLKKEGEELGLVIDLTFTTRYYKPQDLPESLYYVKIFTEGHEVPKDATILSFKRAVRRFLHENQNNDKLIGVHCTHGLNRTGYLVCRYLIDVDGVDPKEAIDLFDKSRGHSIERQNYLDDLTSGPKRSNEGMEEAEAEREPVKGTATSRDSNYFEVNRPHPQMTQTYFNQSEGHPSHFGPVHQRGRNYSAWPYPRPLQDHPSYMRPPLLSTPPCQSVWPSFGTDQYLPPPNPASLPRYSFKAKRQNKWKKRHQSNDPRPPYNQ